MKPAAWIELGRSNRVETFRTLPIPFSKLWSKFSRERTDRVLAKENVPVAFFYPEFKLPLHLENTDIYRRSKANAVRRECGL